MTLLTNPLESILEAWEEAPVLDAEIVDPTMPEPSEPTETLNRQGLTAKQQAAVTRANMAINNLIDNHLLEWWLEKKLAPAFPREMKEAIYLLSTKQ